MPRCDWCHQFARRVTTTPNGRTYLRLCERCEAERELNDSDELRVDDLVGKPGLWERVKRYFHL